ncbi:DNA polymerase I [Ligilactobacillus salitolerans]|uniref:DNA polymerase I n=1 Tax=Ligilactobacillus salitolerans TaxID=1808352 RepID=A0A401IVR3_9LACO|nr:DNA polymerase I [Ligilactobacillus salitolerans]GBG95641.1 DNA polymerase I [Ligilactobacillus salitolerans]
MTKKEKTLLLVDGNSVAFRAFFALQNVGSFTNRSGLHTNAIYVFKKILDNILKKYAPENVLVAFDAGKTTFRTEKFSDYKGGRARTPGELSEQFPYIRKMLEAYGIKSYELENYEADDIIGTLAQTGESKNYRVIIVTGDRDLTQLTTAQTTVAITQKGFSEIEEYTPAHVEEKYGLKPDQIIDMKGLAGDSSDNYPGVTKIGEKTAIKLLKQYQTIEGIYENIDEMKKSKMKEHLIEDRKTALLCKDLATIKKNAPLTLGLADTIRKEADQDGLRSLFEELDFKSFLDELSPNASQQVDFEKLPVTILTADQLDKLPVKKNSEITFYLEMDGKNYHNAPFVGFIFKIDDHYFGARDVALLKEQPLQKILTDQEYQLDVFDFKRTYVGLNRLGIQMAGVRFDLLLVSYLLNNTENSDDVGELAGEHHYDQVKTDAEFYGKGAKRQIPEDDGQLFDHLSHKVLAIHALKEQLFDELKENQQLDLYQDLELPLALVLAKMEIVGITVDTQRLEAMRSEFKERLAELEQEIVNEAGEEFNLNSPKQLGHILFEKLQLPVIKKTKTGYSTAVGVLEQLRGMSPIVDNILNYRQLAKLQSTYIEGLLKVVFKEDHKAHTRYTQTLTATGRLSSVDPNLQNIPIRLEEGRKIRQAFTASHPGWEIFSADYSQIELRVLAHIAQDEHMQEAFKADRDIHANTAMEIFGLADEKDVTPNLRRQAKAVNFGIVYGISDYGLSQNIGITRKQAKQFIDTYFEKFPGVKQYMEQIVKKAQEQGYVETVFKRRRYLPDINNKNFNLRSFAERTAMNSPIQGSAADIIKAAMIKMDHELRAKKMQARMLLQVHDELIFEVPHEELADFEKLVSSVMDSAVDLSVPLKVECAHGKTWFDAK